jgi:hypothetical protein
MDSDVNEHGRPLPKGLEKHDVYIIRQDVQKLAEAPVYKDVDQMLLAMQA